MFELLTDTMVHNWSWLRQFHRDFRRAAVDFDDLFFMGGEL